MQSFSIPYSNMRSNSAAFFVLLVSIASVCYGGWHLKDKDPPAFPLDIKRGFLPCHCSPSKSGAGLTAISSIEGGLHSLAQSMEINMTQGMNYSDALSSHRAIALEKLESCFKQSNYQACINVDRMMRSKYNTTFCTYDKNSKKNLARSSNGTWVTTSKCPKREFDDTPRKMLQVQPGIEWCYCSPNGALKEPKVIEVLETMLQLINETTSQEEANEDLKACAKNFSYTRCINADAHLRGKFNTSLCRWDRITGRNVGPDFMGNTTGYVTVGQCRKTDGLDILGPFVQDEGTASVFAAETRKAVSMNEGCVAVKHLVGYKLQHMRHLLRPVLCHNGFCATPNHAVYYNGRYTSLKVLCESPGIVCDDSQMEVNNLKISAGYLRVRVTAEFEVTPFDFRFPWWAAYIAQGVEDVLESIWISFQVGFAIALLLLLHERLSKAGLGTETR